MNPQPTSPADQQPQQEPVVALHLGVSAVNLLLVALLKAPLPADQSVPLREFIKQEAELQLNARQAKAEADAAASGGTASNAQSAPAAPPTVKTKATPANPAARRSRTKA